MADLATLPRLPEALESEFTPTQLMYCQCYAQGWSQKKTARLMGVSESNVEQRWTRIREILHDKFGVRTRAELVRLTIQDKLQTDVSKDLESIYEEISTIKISANRVESTLSKMGVTGKKPARMAFMAVGAIALLGFGRPSLLTSGATNRDGKVKPEFRAPIEVKIPEKKWTFKTDGEKLNVINDKGVIERTLIHPKRITSVIYSGQESICITGCEDGHIRVWLVSKGIISFELTGHLDAVHSLALNKDQTRLLSAGEDSKIFYWDLQRRKQIKKLVMPVRTVEFAPDESYGITDQKIMFKLR